MRLSRVLPLVALMLVLGGVQSGFAQSVQVQPIYGFSWPTHSIPVSVETSQANATEAVFRAMLTWNLAQQWFITTYMGGVGVPFVFYATNSTFDSIATVAFNQTQTIDDLGRTNWHAWHDQQGNFQRVTASITIDLTRQDGKTLSDAELQTLATHELGHTLGLDHTTFSATDLMNHVPSVLFPSTLNLYAVYLLSQSTNEKNIPQQPVMLPGTIPYVMVSQAELGNVTPPLVQTVTTSSLGMTQIVSRITYGPWPYIGILVALAAAIVALTVRGRRRGLRKVGPMEVEVIFRDEPVAEQVPIQARDVKKRCRHCGAEVQRGTLICRECEMPV